MPDTDISDAAEKVAQGEHMGWAARVGLAARAIVYLLMGWLTVLVALGERAHADQRGALTAVVTRPFGMAMVLVLAIGFACYALWRLSEVFVGVTGEKDGPLPRAVSLVRAVAYSLLSLMALSVYFGSRQTQSSDQEQVAQSLMPSMGGRVLIGLVGVALVGAGCYMVYQGLTTAFLKYFPSLPPARRTAVVWLGRVGTTARGLVFIVAGQLAFLAAWQLDPDKAGGIDDAIRTTLELPAGQWIVLALGIGLILFGLYALAEAAWRRVPDGDTT
jgi:hypothetical protein